MALRTLGGILSGYDDFVALPALPHRNSVPPPQLTADAPVMDVFQPMAVGILPMLRIEDNFLILPSLEGFVGHTFHADKPLIGQIRLNNGIATVAMTYIVVVFHFLDQEPLFLQVLYNQ